LLRSTPVRLRGTGAKRLGARSYGAGGQMSSNAIEGMRPWEQPFWKPARGKSIVLFYLVLIHVLAIAGVILFPIPGLKVLGVALVLAAFGGFGTTVCYHRLLAHRTLKLNRFVEQCLIFWAV